MMQNFKAVSQKKKLCRLPHISKCYENALSYYRIVVKLPPDALFYAYLYFRSFCQDYYSKKI